MALPHRIIDIKLKGKTFIPSGVLTGLVSRLFAAEYHLLGLGIKPVIQRRTFLGLLRFVVAV